MTWPARTFMAAGVAAAIALLGGAFWYLGRADQAAPSVLNGSTAALNPPAPEQFGVAYEREPASTHPAVAASPPESPADPVEDIDEQVDRAPRIVVDGAALPWELQLARIQQSVTTPARKAAAIFALLPRLPFEAQETAAQQATALVRDTDYTTTALPVLLNSQTHGQALSVLFADLMERPDSLRLPALLAIAQDATHSFSSPALDDLKYVLGIDHGSNWNAWKASVEKALTVPLKPVK